MSKSPKNLGHVARVLGVLLGATAVAAGAFVILGGVDFSATAPDTAAAGRRVIADLMVGFGTGAFGLAFMAVSAFTPLPWEAATES